MKRSVRDFDDLTTRQKQRRLAKFVNATDGLSDSDESAETTPTSSFAHQESNDNNIVSGQQLNNELAVVPVNVFDSAAEDLIECENQNADSQSQSDTDSSDIGDSGSSEEELLEPEGFLCQVPMRIKKKGRKTKNIIIFGLLNIMSCFLNNIDVYIRSILSD